MAYSRLLLLLIGALSSYLPGAEAKPIDFWCQPEIRRYWRENADRLIDRMIDCQGTDDIHATPIQCPFVGLNYRRWNNLTVLEKYADVKRDLHVFHAGLEEANNQTKFNCQPLLPDIKRHIRNNKAILARQIQNDTLEASSPLQMCSGLTEVLKRYQKLLQGKLELFVNLYKDSICNEHMTDFNGNG